MLAYHWLQENMKAGRGSEKAWTEGEERTLPASTKLELCDFGYHSSPSLWAAFEYAPGPVACIVEISEPEGQDDTKFVSRTRKLIKAVNVQKGLGNFACDCAERALQRERDAGREPDARSWAAIETARAYWRGEVSQETSDAAGAAAWDAAGAAAWRHARVVAWDAAWDAAGAAAWDAEREWQKQRFNKVVLLALVGKPVSA